MYSYIFEYVKYIYIYLPIYIYILASPLSGATMPLSASHWALDQRARVRGSPGETVPCTLMAPSACKISCGCNALLVLIQTISLGVPKLGSHPHRCRLKLWWQVYGPSLGMTPRQLVWSTYLYPPPGLHPRCKCDRVILIPRIIIIMGIKNIFRMCLILCQWNILRLWVISFTEYNI